MPLLRRLQRSNYRLLGLVGQGQFGQVYCAVHRRSGRLVALKNLSRDRLTTHRFLRELRFLLSLEHPNIANCYALEQSAMGRQLVLDYCEGGTLRQLMEQGTSLTLAEIFTLITDILSGLEHAHNQGIVHCDIKPENILLFITPGGWQPKISDFGIARLSQEIQSLEGSTGATGSPAYMAPERFYHQYSAASDLYALGVILYEMLVGDRPFRGTPSQLMVAHMNQPVTFPDTLPQSLQTFIGKTLQKLAARRYRSATEMKGDLLLMRSQFTASDLRTRYPQAPWDGERARFQPQGYQPLKVAPVQLLPLSPGHGPIAEGCLLRRDPRTPQVTAWPLPAQGKGNLGTACHWPLPQEPTALLATSTDLLATTETTLYRLGAAGQVTPVVPLPPRIKAVASAQGHWLAYLDPAQPQHLHWIPLGRGIPYTTPLPVFSQPPSHLLALDANHVVVVVPQGEETRFYGVTRRGLVVGHLSLYAPIAQVAPTLTRRRILALEAGVLPSLLIIDLVPFRVVRCRLDVATPWLGELALGYVGCSDQGQLRLVNGQGQLIGHVDGLPPPQAIAVHPPYHLWLSTQTPSPTLHAIDLRKLDLDIIF